MSTLRLLSSLSMIAVFLASSIHMRSSDRPRHMVLIFQLAIRRAGSFLTFFFVLPGAVFQSTSQAKTLSSKHPLKQVDHGGTAP